MLFGHSLWRSSRHGPKWLERSLHSAPTYQILETLVLERGVSPRLNSLTQQPRWFSTSPIARTRRLQDDARDEDLVRDVAGSSATTTPELETPPISTKAPLLDPSSPHSSLHSFYAYARRTGLSQTSSVYTGTTYEYLTQTTLRSYGFDLHRVGGRGDRGVDLIGVWHIPIISSSGEWKERKILTPTGTTSVAGTELAGYETQPLKVLVQCKRMVGKAAKIGPHLMRELDGAVRGARSAALFNAVFPQHAATNTTEGTGATTAGQERKPEEEENGQQSPGGHEEAPNPASGSAIGVLVSTKPATKGVVDSMRRSSRALVWILMEETGRTPSSPAGSDEAPGEVEAKVEAGDDESISQHSGESQDPSSPSPPSICDQDPNPNPTPAPQLLGGRIRQMLWNQAAREAGLEGVDVVKRYDSHGCEEVVLMRGGRVWGSLGVC